MPTADFLVVGAGIAGASVAYRLAADATVTLLERESQPGYHTTGRSAAFFVPSYGGPAARPLTLASEDFLRHPPDGFGEGLLRHRPAIYIGRPDQADELAAFHRQLKADDPAVELLGKAETLNRASLLRPEYVAGGVYETACYDIDVGRLHLGFLKGFRRRGGTLVTDAGVTEIKRRGDLWVVTAGGERYEAPVLINAAGAWGDELAEMAGVRPVGLAPKRRTVITFAGPSGRDIADWPLIFDIGHQFYFKPESGLILASPSDETPSPPCDARPEDLDIAYLVDRLERATTLSIPKISNKWAGLRTFAPDRGIVIGLDDLAPGFFWLVGQGGFGIQTAPAASLLAAKLALGAVLPEDLRRKGVDIASHGVARLR